MQFFVVVHCYFRGYFSAFNFEINSLHGASYQHHCLQEHIELFHARTWFQVRRMIKGPKGCKLTSNVAIFSGDSYLNSVLGVIPLWGCLFLIHHTRGRKQSRMSEAMHCEKYYSKEWEHKSKYTNIKITMYIKFMPQDIGRCLKVIINSINCETQLEKVHQRRYCLNFLYTCIKEDKILF